MLVYTQEHSHRKCATIDVLYIGIWLLKPQTNLAACEQGFHLLAE